VRGQIALLQGPAGAIQRVVLHRDAYLIPRSDGRVLVGSTVEEAGYDNHVTAEGAAFLFSRAFRFAPGIKDYRVEQLWSGLRPATPDRLPHLGRPASVQGLILATGHFRNGVLLGPLTGRIVADLVEGKAPPIDLTPFHPDR
jgi:glycine oxidase